eukprot:TRINITY_DN85_c0_g1_i1.p1 TRINITY_DN85_c0_g1~~TRINITY_DN85_c0_g1_i1.p1  ORF type:complete len:224 (+),score=40.90 TRINITY_DN85_c0_g1_i1:86-757(+)
MSTFLAAHNPKSFPSSPQTKRSPSPPKDDHLHQARPKPAKQVSKPTRAQTNVSFLFDPSRDDNSQLPYYEQSDPLMNTPEKLLERSALKFHPDVRNAIMKLHELFEIDADGNISKASYISLHERILRGLIPKYSGDMQAVAEEDWAADSKGADVLDVDAFLEAMFTLVDVWTVSTDVAEYVAFLETLAMKIKYPLQTLVAAPYAVMDQYASGVSVTAPRGDSR